MGPIGKPTYRCPACKGFNIRGHYDIMSIRDQEGAYMFPVHTLPGDEPDDPSKLECLDCGDNTGYLNTRWDNP
jgi:hypothetical protein